MSMDTELGKRMIARADADRLASDHPLRLKAAEFEKAAGNLYSGGEQPVKSFLGAWARARRAWCDYTEEPLI